MRSPNGKEGVSLHSFTFPEDRYVRLLVFISESVVRVEFEILDIISREKRSSQLSFATRPRK
jgi:hypothetical protein